MYGRKTSNWLVVVALAIAALFGAVAPNAAAATTSPKPVVSWHMTGTIDMYVRDDESWPAQDVHCYLTQYPDFTMNSASGTWTFKMIGPCGDEVRVELDHNYTVQNGNYYVSGQLRLYEGTSADTSDLDGVVNFHFWVVTTAHYFVTVHNDEEGGDDLGEVEFNLKSTQV